MVTEVLYTDNEVVARETIQRAVSMLHAGEVVALPTETVYGLGADALDPAAVEKIFAAKERPHFDPLIIHLPRKHAFRDVCDITPEYDKVIIPIIEHFWPGPLTLLLPKKAIIPDIVTAGLPTVGVRMCDHPVFKRIAKSFDRPIAAPSANLFGKLSPTSTDAVLEQLDGRIPAIIDGGACARGLESTIIRVSPGKPKTLIEIVRPGPITAEDLKQFGKVSFADRNQDVEDLAPEAPGQLAAHYAPTTPIQMLESPEDFQPEDGKRYGLLSYRGQAKDGYIQKHDWDEIRVLSPGSGRLAEAGIRFFHSIRDLDQSGLDRILVEPIPERGVGMAMREKLKKAQFGTAE
ncbi:MAG: L-threonylcarbamoyladenylate synthase [Verrucomicrobiota bacterium]